MIERQAVYFALGGMAGGFLYLALHILPNVAEFMRQFNNSIGIRSQVVLTNQMPVFGPLSNLVRTVQDYIQASPLEALIVIVALGLAHWNKTTRPLALLLLPIIAAYSLLTQGIGVIYLINFWALVALILAGVFSTWIADRQAVIIVLVAAIALPTLFTMFEYDHDGRNERVLSIARQIATTIKPEEKVVALHYFFFVMPDQPHLIAPFMPDYAEIAHADVQGLAVWQAIAPDVFVVSTALAEPANTLARTYRDQRGFVEVARYDELGCCITVYRRLPGNVAATNPR